MSLSFPVILTCLAIALARVTDISLDTIRTVAIVQGRRLFAAVLGFVEAGIYICVVAQVLMHFDHPLYALAYATGFAAGTYLGIVLEQRLAFGEQVASIFSHKGTEMAALLRADSYRVTEMLGHGRDGVVTVLYVGVPRRQMPALLSRVQALDPACYFIVNDVRAAGRPRRHIVV